MVGRFVLTAIGAVLIVISPACKKKPQAQPEGASLEGRVKLMTLDPGHFHAALVQKTMYEQVSPTVHVYAPDGPELSDYLSRIEGFNTRNENPTSWQQKVYTGEDFFQKMLEEKPGNVVVLAGNNKKKAEYIKACVDASLNVLADKPMCINSAGFELLKQAFDSAAQNNVLLYDIMTERSEITTVLQKELVHNEAVFGRLRQGSVDDPSVVKESVHHFFKYVAGSPIKRPAWYFDTRQQGEGIVDVTTHLVDLVMWESFPNEPIDYRTDVKVKKANRWPTLIALKQYSRVTGLDDFPSYLKERLDSRGNLPCYANGEIIFTVKGIHARVAVTWRYEAPEGTKDTHFSVMKGTKADIYIRQGKEQNYRPELYVETAVGQSAAELAAALKDAIALLQATYRGIELKQEGEIWHVLIPDKYRSGHEAHFGQVMERYLDYLAGGKLPAWEVPNMITKYYITTTALDMAKG